MLVRFLMTVGRIFGPQNTFICWCFVLYSVFIYQVILVCKETDILTKLNSVTYVVHPGNFNYWSLHYQGQIRIKLTPLSGDADLYICENKWKPSYDPDLYDLHSATCGIEEVTVPATYKRPISIGVYGFAENQNSSYLLEIYASKDPSTADFQSTYLALSDNLEKDKYLNEVKKHYTKKLNLSIRMIRQTCYFYLKKHLKKILKFILLVL